MTQFGTKLINQSCSVFVLNLVFLSYQQGPDYRLYKSEPELTTVTEVDESNGEDRSEYPSEHSGNKGTLSRAKPSNTLIYIMAFAEASL